MRRLTGRGLNPTQLAKAYRNVLELTSGTEIAKDKEKIKAILKEEYAKMFPNSFMPIDAKEETIASIYNSWGMVEELACSLGLGSLEDVLNAIKNGAKSENDANPQQNER